MTQTLLSGDQILSAVDLAFEDVMVPEWGGTVRLQQMNAKESVQFNSELTKLGGDAGMYLLLVYSARDADGNRLLKSEHVEQLEKKNISVLNRLQLIALRLNKMDPVGKEALKNALSAAGIDAAPTPSPVNSDT